MSQNYFIAAIGGHLLRGTNPNPIYIKDYKMAKALFALQDDNYSFRPMPDAGDVANVCTSCEG